MARPSQAREHLIQAAHDLIWENSYGSTSVDDICSRAGVRKGSFYHFFESKSHLAVSTIDATWEKMLPELNEIFSPLTPPLQRFTRYAARTLKYQEERLALTGHVGGCPLCSLGSEVGTQDELIRSKVAEIFTHKLCFYESAIRDAAQEGLCQVADPAQLARTLQTFMHGTLTQARLLNDLAPVRHLGPSFLSLLTSRPAASAVPA